MTEDDMAASERVDTALQLAHFELSPTAADRARGRAALGLPDPVRPLASQAVASRPGAWAALRASGKAGAFVSAVLLGVGFGAGYWLGRVEPRADDPNGVQPVALSSSEPLGSRGSTVDPGTGAANSSLHAAAHAPRAEARPDAGAPATADDGRRASVSSAMGAGAPLAPMPRSAPRAPKAQGSASALERPLAETRGSQTREELALMRRIERALRNDQPALALVLLAEVEGRFPRSALEEERLAASVMAHCGLHDPGHERRAESFLESRPRSVYRTRVLAACDTPDVPEGRANGAAASDGKPRRGDQ